MPLSIDLISEFAKITNDNKASRKNRETTVYGTIMEDAGVFYVKIDGSEVLTPITSTTNVKAGERVSVLIKNHNAMVNGNISSPSATIVDIGDITDASGKIAGFEVRLSEIEGTVDSNTDRITSSESAFQMLTDSISTLITDANGNSMMTQTSDGWTFNISSIEDTISQATNQLGELSSTVDEAKSALDNLESLANDLTKKTAYINMTTDDEGNPCIELGKSDSAFRVRITNTSVDFLDGTTKIAYVNNQSLYIERTIIKEELQVGEGSGVAWKKRSNGHVGLRWVGDI